jgi:hypothetical protein
MGDVSERTCPLGYNYVHIGYARSCRDDGTSLSEMELDSIWVSSMLCSARSNTV